jgi:hypothetical protein
MHTGRIAAPRVRIAAHRPEGAGVPVAANQTESHPILMPPMRISGEGFHPPGDFVHHPWRAGGANHRAP